MASESDSSHMKGNFHAQFICCNILVGRGFSKGARQVHCTNLAHA